MSILKLKNSYKTLLIATAIISAALSIITAYITQDAIPALIGIPCSAAIGAIGMLIKMPEPKPVGFYGIRNNLQEVVETLRPYQETATDTIKVTGYVFKGSTIPEDIKYLHCRDADKYLRANDLGIMFSDADEKGKVVVTINDLKPIDDEFLSDTDRLIIAKSHRHNCDK